VYLQGVTSKTTARTIDDLRGIVSNQVALLKERSAVSVLSREDADVLLKIVKTFQMVDTVTDREHAKYDLTRLSEDELKALC
jgi:hypothetical protein